MDELLEVTTLTIDCSSLQNEQNFASVTFWTRVDSANIFQDISGGKQFGQNFSQNLNFYKLWNNCTLSIDRPVSINQNPSINKPTIHILLISHELWPQLHRLCRARGIVIFIIPRINRRRVVGAHAKILKFVIFMQIFRTDRWAYACCSSRRTSSSSRRVASFVCVSSMMIAFNSLT